MSQGLNLPNILKLYENGFVIDLSESSSFASEGYVERVTWGIENRSEAYKPEFTA